MTAIPLAFDVMEMIEIEPEVNYTGSIRLGTVEKHSAQPGNVSFLQFLREKENPMFSYEILQSYNDLEMMVYNYVLEHKEEVKYMAVRELAEAVHVSASTIIRFCKKTGCEGYSEFKVQFKLFLKEEKENKRKLTMDNGKDEIMYFLHTVTSTEYEESIIEVTQMVQEPCRKVRAGYNAGRF